MRSKAGAASPAAPPVPLPAVPPVALLPDPSLVPWFTTDNFDGHTVLTPGITSQQVIDQWVDHREHDPYAEYPEYLS